MTRLRPGALEQLSDRQKTRLVKAHDKIAKDYENALTGQATDQPRRFNRTAATRLMHHMPTPYGTQSMVRPTPRGRRLQRRAERIADRMQQKSMTGIERSWSAQALKKEFVKARERDRLKTLRPGLQR